MTLRPTWGFCIRLAEYLQTKTAKTAATNKSFNHGN